MRTRAGLSVLLNNEAQAIFHVSSIQINLLIIFVWKKVSLLNAYETHILEIAVDTRERERENRDIRTITLVAINQMPLLFLMQHLLYSGNFVCVCVSFTMRPMHSEYEYVFVGGISHSVYTKK